MSAPIIMVRYAELRSIASRLNAKRDAMQQMLQTLERTMQPLIAGEWQGQAAQRCFQEFESVIVPAYQRAIGVFDASAQVTLEIAKLMQAAEAEAATLFAHQSFSSKNRIMGEPLELPDLPYTEPLDGSKTFKPELITMPPPPPPPAQPPDGDGSGKHGAMGEPTEQDRANHSKMSNAATFARFSRFFSETGYHMQHYLNNSGEPLNVSVDDMLDDMPTFRKEVELRYKNEIIPQINQKLRSDYHGEPLEFNVTIPWNSEFYPDRNEDKNWYYAVGGFSYAQTAYVRVTPAPDGSPNVEVISQVHMFDRYNWDQGKSVTIPSSGIEWIDNRTIANDHITDEEMGRLHGTGIAQEYDLTGTSSGQKHFYTYDPLTGIK
ncbi:WXG100 family type VII secretion target [Herpetosiphon llansteffanensis]|uniref:WXG100 family type VII secretion target n=1 Tax=Herpetosiphon llansteffanensis TaxID=2094568 RepID=UPI000D7C2F60|nr:WXG100 family type VII secretion target [Herpetosiphon llansteffanensis]